MFTLYQIALAPARKPYRIGLWFTHKKRDFGAMFVTEWSCASPVSKVESHPGWGGGVLPYLSHTGMCRPKGWGFCAVLVWKRVLVLPILVWNRLWLTFAVLFSATMTLIPVLCKRVMLRFVTTSMSKMGVENDIFWSEIGSGFGEPGVTPPLKNIQEYPPRTVTYRIGVILNGYLFASARKPIRYSVNIALNAGLVHKIELDLRHYCFFFSNIANVKFRQILIISICLRISFFPFCSVETINCLWSNLNCLAK